MSAHHVEVTVMMVKSINPVQMVMVMMVTSSLLVNILMKRMVMSVHPVEVQMVMVMMVMSVHPVEVQMVQRGPLQFKFSTSDVRDDGNF